jgi:hypothetical protein
MNKIQLTYSRPTFLTASSKSSLADTSWAGSETVPRGCPRDSLVFNQSWAHWRAKLLNQKEISRQKMGRIDLKQFHSKQNVLFKRVSAFFRYIQKRTEVPWFNWKGKPFQFSVVWTINCSRYSGSYLTQVREGKPLQFIVMWTINCSR